MEQTPPKTWPLYVFLFIVCALGGFYFYKNADTFSTGQKEDEYFSDVIPEEKAPSDTAQNSPAAALLAKTDAGMTPDPIAENNPLKNEKNMITIKTNLGDIVFETYNNDAPKTVENFITLAKKGFYDGVIFHRVIDGFMIQGGDPTGTGTGGPGYNFEDELNPAAASYKEGYKKGVVAMANAGPNTNGSQFFIMLADTPLPHSYTIFGKVVSGQEVVDAIGKSKTNSEDKPLSPITMEKVIVSE